MVSIKKQFDNRIPGCEYDHSKCGISQGIRDESIASVHPMMRTAIDGRTGPAMTLPDLAITIQRRRVTMRVSDVLFVRGHLVWVLEGQK